MRYTPFNKEFTDFSTSDLGVLREISEGWYVEYKSQEPSTRDLAKSLSSFANQYGGWLFIGVAENPESHTAESFPGIKNDELAQVLESIRNAAKDITRPQLDYLYRALEGPNEAIGLNSERSVVAVHVAEGSNTPYIHNDGRIYIRIGDSSSPIPMTDKATFDRLYRRGEDRRTYLKTLIERSPILSKGEEDNSFIHLSILSDPYQSLGHRYQGAHADFSAAISTDLMPFDNIYTAPDGFIARQIGTNNRYNRVFTWEFSRNCNSFVTIPIPTMQLQEPGAITHESSLQSAWEPYSIGAEFVSALVSKGLEASRVLNLNILLLVLGGIVDRHRTIVGQAKVRGPLYIKARIENVWRTVPFIDLKQYMAHVEKFDFPVVQDSDLMVPVGTLLETFVVSSEDDRMPTESEGIQWDGAFEIWARILEALGIPLDLPPRNAKNLFDVSVRESEIHHGRASRMP